MELAPVPRRRPWSSGVRVLVVLVVLVPVALMTLVPMAFGFERYVISGTEMGGSLGRGAVAFERRVPIGAIEVGDVVTYPTATGSTGALDATLTTRRVTRIQDGTLYTRADRAPDSTEDVLTATAHPTISRVVRGVPYVGYPFLGSLAHPGWALLVVLLGAALGFVSVQIGGRRARPLTARTP